MYKHWQYFKYIIKHKYHVYRAGRFLKLSRFQLLIHDLSKFYPIEWFAYVNYFYGTKIDETKSAFEYAWNHHQKVNKHHYQYFIRINDSGDILALEMPRKYAFEMLADWYGAGYAITGKNDVVGWWEKTRGNKTLHENTVKLIEEYIQQLGTFV